MERTHRLSMSRSMGMCMGRSMSRSMGMGMCMCMGMGMDMWLARRLSQPVLDACHVTCMPAWLSGEGDDCHRLMVRW